MGVHLIKLCVGVDSIEDLAKWQARRLLEGGSLYWVIKGIVEVRQRLLDITAGTKDDGTPCCVLILDAVLVPVSPVPRRPFQGWRYLDAAEAPADLKPGARRDIAAMPAKLRQELAALGLL